ncbi:MAG TPA: 2-hydroxychromene-2-carboxylate isomerase [Myxococcales bacterium]|nr:2-hydroxychromene-2-carboxylate isomerase [Myxococcales bacterium]
MTFDFFFDIGSPYSYLASTQIEGIEKRTGAKAHLLPVTLGGLRKSTGHQMPPPVQLKYMSEDTARWAKQYGVKMQIPAMFPASTIKALRAIIAAQDEGKGEEAMRALFHVYWAEGANIEDPKVVEGALAAAGLDGKAILARTDMQAIKDALRRNTDLALARGVFGVPTIFVGERSFWGNDRLHFVEAEIRRAQG